MKNPLNKIPLIGNSDKQALIDQKLKFAKDKVDKIIKLLCDEEAQLDDINTIIGLLQETIMKKQAEKFNSIYLNHIINE